MINLKTTFVSLLLLTLTASIQAKELKTIETDDATVEVRIFPASGDTLLLGFACDEGKSIIEEKTAASLAQDGVEVWMPDMLSAFMLPNVQSSLPQISTAALLAIIETAVETGKKVYLVASGPHTQLLLRSAGQWEASNKPPLAGAILIFPRLIKGDPDPGKAPEYVDAVGTTRLPIILLEGGRTPNRWGVNTLSQALGKGGSKVVAKVIPEIRGHLFDSKDTNRTEDVVTSQMAGLIKVSLFYIKEYEQ
ncbi:MAG: hypothetical protein RQ982_05340 [Gammaproteobacteria bacterium]|nr:hypothetical protein [Gammaproteobacteria bacterium]